MNILFVHQNFPGQYREILAHLAAMRCHRIVFLTQRRGVAPPPGVALAHYRPDQGGQAPGHPLAGDFARQMAVGHAAHRRCRELARDGFQPDIVIGHPGWGELAFLKEVWPDAPILAYLEYYYRAEGGPADFDPEFPPAPELALRMKARNAINHFCLPDIAVAQSPTRWQLETYPRQFRDRAYCCHDGIRCDRLGPDATARLGLGRLDEPLRPGDEVVTFVARDLEPTRGFHSFMRSLALVLERRPHARAVIVGGNGASYGARSAHQGGYRGAMEAELGDAIDWGRVHFLGRVSYESFRRIIQVSRCHVYLTAPFVLSWSLLEAMAMGARIVASDVAPVREVIEHGTTGWLADFFSPRDLTDRITAVLADPQDHDALAKAARERVEARYDFNHRCLPIHLENINSCVPARLRIDLRAAAAAH